MVVAVVVVGFMDMVVGEVAIHDNVDGWSVTDAWIVGGFGGVVVVECPKGKVVTVLLVKFVSCPCNASTSSCTSSSRLCSLAFGLRIGDDGIDVGGMLGRLGLSVLVTEIVRGGHGGDDNDDDDMVMRLVVRHGIGVSSVWTMISVCV